MERARSEEEEKGARIRGMMVDEGSICTSAASSSRPDVGREHPRGSQSFEMGKLVARNLSFSGVGRARERGNGGKRREATRQEIGFITKAFSRISRNDSVELCRGGGTRFPFAGME